MEGFRIYVKKFGDYHSEVQSKSLALQEIRPSVCGVTCIKSGPQPCQKDASQL